VGSEERDDLLADLGHPLGLRLTSREHDTMPTEATLASTNPSAGRPITEPMFTARDPVGSVLLRLKVNGLECDVAVEPWTTLLDALRDRASVAINPFRTGAPGVTNRAAMITGADEAITAHQRVAEASWREAMKGPSGAARLRQLLNVASPVS
jgi:hypothetical protein